MKLHAKEDRIYNEQGDCVAYVNMFRREVELGNYESQKLEGECWLDYHQRTEPERKELKKQRFQLTAELAEAYNGKPDITSDK